MHRKKTKKNSTAKIILLICFITVLCFGAYKCVNLFLETKDSLATEFFSESKEIQNPDWNLILINEENQVPKNYEVVLLDLSNGERVDTRIYPFLQKMFDDARSEGIFPFVRAGYRTKDEQKTLLDNTVYEYMNEGYSKSQAKKMARDWVALPGTSEHQLGIAVDINADQSRSTNETVYEWLKHNAHNYGFILRYPPEKSDITGIQYEPWHYRFVGEEVAREIYTQGVCLEEYLQSIS